ncbi:MAG: hypothetical protein A2X61_05565 [Ignavibacteria bacterium GWB2_35_12]|nr:MAG: hypothetical protein A2X61_05565 [Ignavibacteria bacterium GWB2_35_12]OGU93177.1 MAG: hypothetical protein A2220_11185 [Ignavibacteria bacterium RIFOXYA2_FULL_35_10]OGV19986.1 MAG: hypothetical protein A2475_00185 [Ignavibacteria bacterium RIFOXYC2_FULL_35_21]
MTDTSPEFEKFYREKMMSLTSDERIRIGLSMNETARNIVWSSIPKDLPEEERRVQFFLRYYKNDFTEKQKNVIIEGIRKGK